MFSKRLEMYRKERGLNKREMSKVLNISEAYYNMIENGKREPSKKFMYELVLESKKPEEYWRFGLTEKSDLLNAREEFKRCRETFDYWNSIGEINTEIINNVFSEFNIDNLKPMEQMLLIAIKADLEHLYQKTKKQE